jgi:hypothetical protein
LKEQIRRPWRLGATFALVVLAVFIIYQYMGENTAAGLIPLKTVMLGGAELRPAFSPDTVQAAALESDATDAALNERYHRPSKAAGLLGESSFDYIDRPNSGVPVFETPEQLIYAYYSVLREAADMEGYSGSCGSVGEGTTFLPYAYSMFSEEKRARTSYQEFEDSFKGVGHTTLLRLLPLTAEAGGQKTYMVEAEYITGPEQPKNDASESLGSYFAYVYGTITVEHYNANGWKIADITYMPENFLCAPYHSWFYDAASSVPIIFEDNLKLVDKVDQPRYEDGITTVDAEGPGGKYRFEFARLTNGYDILIHEYILRDGKYAETDLLTGNWKDFKLTAPELAPAPKAAR